MNWRIHLTNQAIRELHTLSGKPSLLAIWIQANRVEFYDLETGALHGHRQIDAPPDGDYLSEEWQTYLASLIDIKGRSYLPTVTTPHATIYTTDDGKLHLFRESYNTLKLMTEGKVSELDTSHAESFISLDLDRALGIVVALDTKGRLSIYQQSIFIGDFDIGLMVDELVGATVIISNGGGTIFATDGRQIVMTDASGDVLRRLNVHYNIRQIACSSGGGMIVTSDNEAGLIRVYSGSDLTPTHQRFAVDLIAEAQQVQLMADLPPLSVAISALTAGNRGAIGFAMSGVICMTNVNNLTKLPRPQSLF
jgi:hypothetical protein